MSHTDLGSSSEHTVTKDFFQNAVETWKFAKFAILLQIQRRAWQKRKVSEPLQKSFSPKIVLIEVQFDPYTF